MGIRNRHSGYQVDFRWETRRIRRSGFKTEAEALRWEADAKEKLGKGQPIDDVVSVTSSVWTMDTLLDSVYARHWKGTKNGEEAYRLAGHAVDHFGEQRNPKELTADVIDAWVALLKKDGNKNPTINRKLSALGKMLRFALSRGIIDKMPHMERYRESQGRTRWYTLEEERKLLVALDDETRDFVIFLLDTGCRLSEALNLQLRDTTDTSVTFEDTKSHKRRSVPLTKRVAGIVMERRKKMANMPQGAPLWNLAVNHLRDQWAVARESAGLTKDKQAVIHTCRHTFASRLVQGGVSLQVVQALLGHATLTMTLRYAHLAPHNVEQAIKVLETAA